MRCRNRGGGVGAIHEVEIGLESWVARAKVTSTTSPVAAVILVGKVGQRKPSQEFLFIYME